MFRWNLSKREKTILAICIILAISTIFYSTVLEPAITHLKTLNSQIESKIVLIVKNARLLNMSKILEVEYLKYRDFIEISKDEEEEIAKTLAKIEEISKNSGCHIVNIKPRTSKKRGNYKEIIFEVITETSIEGLSRFLYEIETSRECMSVMRFMITSKSTAFGKVSDTLKCTFLISKIVIM